METANEDTEVFPNPSSIDNQSDPKLLDDEDSVDGTNRSPVVTMTVEPEPIERSLQLSESSGIKDEVSTLGNKEDLVNAEIFDLVVVAEDIVDRDVVNNGERDQPMLMSGGSSPRGLKEKNPSFQNNPGLKAVTLVCQNINISSQETALYFKVIIGGLTQFESAPCSQWRDVHIPTGLTGNQLPLVDQLEIYFEVFNNTMRASEILPLDAVVAMNEEFVKRLHEETDPTAHSQQYKLQLKIQNQQNQQQECIDLTFDAYFDLEMTTIAVGKSAKGGLRQPKVPIPAPSDPPTVMSRLAQMVPRAARRALKLTVLDAKPLGHPIDGSTSDIIEKRNLKKTASVLSRFTETVVQMKFQTPWGKSQGRKKRGGRQADKMRQSVETSAAEILEGGSVASWRQSLEGTITLPLQKDHSVFGQEEEYDEEEEEEDEYDEDDFEEDDHALMAYASNGMATSFQRSDLNKTVVVEFMGRRTGASDVLIGSTEATLREVLRNSVSLDPTSSLSLDVAPEHASSLSILCDDHHDDREVGGVPLQWALSYDASMILCDPIDSGVMNGTQPVAVNQSNQEIYFEEMEQSVPLAEHPSGPVLVPASNIHQEDGCQDLAQTMFQVPNPTKRSIAKKKANDLARRRKLSLNKSVDRVPDIVWQAQRKFVRAPAWRSESLSAQLIQRRYRGFMARSQMKKRNVAASTISRYWRGKRDWKLVMKMKLRSIELEQFTKESSERKIRRLRLEAEMKKLKTMNPAELAALKKKDMEQTFRERDELLKKKTDAFLAVSKIRTEESNFGMVHSQEQDPFDIQIEKLEKEAINVLRSGRVSELATQRAIGVSRTRMSEEERSKMGDLGCLYHRVDAQVRARKENKSKGEVYHDLFEARKRVATCFAERSHVSEDWEQRKLHINHSRKLMNTLHNLPSLASVRSSFGGEEAEKSMDPFLRPPKNTNDLEACGAANTRTLNALRAERKNEWWSAVLPEDLSGTPRDVRESVQDPWEASLWWYGWARKVISVKDDGSRTVSYVDFHGDAVSQADLLRRWQELGVGGRQAVASLQNKSLEDRARDWAVAICDEVWRQRRLVIGPRQLDDLITRKKEILKKAASLIQQCWREHSQRMTLLRAATQDKVINALSLLVNAVAGASGTHVQESMLRNLADDLVSNVTSKPKR